MMLKGDAWKNGGERDGRVSNVDLLMREPLIRQVSRMLIKCAVRLIGSCVPRRFRDTRGKSRE